MTGYDDPGWGPALKILVPFAVLLKSVRRPAWHNALVNLRFVHVAFTAAPLTYLLALRYIVEWTPGAGTWLAAMALVSGAALAATVWVRGRPLDPSSEARIAESYRANYFVSVAVGESPALFGLVSSIVVNAIGPYLIGMAAGLVGLLLAAPTRRDIARRQEEIAARGSTLAVGAALVKAPVKRGRSAR